MVNEARRFLFSSAWGVIWPSLAISSLVVGLSLLADGLRLTQRRIVFEGRDLLTLSDEEMRRVRGNRIAMIFQEPMTALNPVFTVGEQIAEVVRVHAGASRKAAWARAVGEGLRLDATGRQFEGAGVDLGGQ